MTFKHILAAVTAHAPPSLTNMHVPILSVLSLLPYELFSTADSIVYTDKEGLQIAVAFVNKFGRIEV